MEILDQRLVANLALASRSVTPHDDGRRFRPRRRCADMSSESRIVPVFVALFIAGQSALRPLFRALMPAALLVVLGGCAARPSHTARFWMSGGQTMELKVDGEQPTVQLRPDFGPLQDVEWQHAAGVARFEGVPARGELLLTMRGGDLLRFSDQLGTRVELKLWNATGYTLTSSEGAATVATSSVQE
jgi:hypothetical protein